MNEVFEPSEHEGKIRGVHSTFPFFVRMAYGWLLVTAVLGVAATRWDTSGGIWGAGRILPAFAGMRMLWSTKLMFVGLALVTLGCTLRVSCEVLAYQGYAAWAWSVLPISALCELAGTNDLRHQHSRHIYARTQPLAETAGDCRCAGKDFLKRTKP